jgi:hypothetical protein
MKQIVNRNTGWSCPWRTEEAVCGDDDDDDAPTLADICPVAQGPEIVVVAI